MRYLIEYNEFINEEKKKISLSEKEKAELFIKIIEDLEAGLAKPLKYHYYEKGNFNITDSDGDWVETAGKYVDKIVYHGFKLGDYYIYTQAEDYFEFKFEDTDHNLYFYDKKITSKNLNTKELFKINLRKYDSGYIIPNILKNKNLPNEYNVEEFFLRLEDLRSKKKKKKKKKK